MIKGTMNLGLDWSTRAKREKIIAKLTASPDPDVCEVVCLFAEYDAGVVVVESPAAHFKKIKKPAERKAELCRLMCAAVEGLTEAYVEQLLTCAMVISARWGPREDRVRLVSAAVTPR